MRQFKQRILNKDWRIKVYTESFYIRTHGDDSEATTLSTHEIHMREDSLEFCTVLHEIVHAYMFTLYLHSAELSAHQTEEVMCELIGNRWKELFQTAFQLYLKLIKKQSQEPDVTRALKRLEELTKLGILS